MRADRPSRALRSALGAPGVLFGLAIGLCAATLAAWVIRPFRAGVVGSDSVSSVLYFDRLIAGERLELFLGTTPKPLLSLVYGPLYLAFEDWRPISWLAIVVYATAVAATALLVRRVTGSMPSAAFTAAGLLASVGLLQDASFAYTVSWALLGWSSAGLALTMDPPRYGWAGVVLMLTALVRLETLFIVVLGLMALAAVALAGHHAPRAAWLIGIGLAAIPIAAVFDLLLTGDPLYTYAVPALGTEIRQAQDPGTAARFIGRHLAAPLPLVPLAAIGVAQLARRRAWPVLIGLAALGPGIAAFVLLLGVRGIFVLDRYALPLDLAIIVAAGIGFGALVDYALRVVPTAGAGLATVVAGGAAVVVALALSPAIAPLDERLRAGILANRTDLIEYHAARPAIGAALDAMPAVRDMPVDRRPSQLEPSAPPALLVPAGFLPTAAIELDLPLTQVQRTDVNALASDGRYPSAGQIVYHDASLDVPPERAAFLEVDQPIAIGAVRLVPLVADADGRYWVIRVEAASGR